MAPRQRITRFVHQGEDTSRIKGLSDGLFAVVLTLLVLELKPPDGLSEGGRIDVTAYLVGLWPELFSFLLTFLVGGIYWIAHHWDLEHIVVYNRRLLWINLMFLLAVSLLPFTTALLDDGPDSAVWSLYSANMALIGLTLMALWGYAVSSRFIDPNLDDGFARYMVLFHLLNPMVFLLSMVVAQFSPGLAPYLLLLIPVLRFLWPRVFLGPEPPTDRGTAGRRQGATWQMTVWTVVAYSPVVVFVLWSLWLWLNGKL